MEPDHAHRGDAPGSSGHHGDERRVLAALTVILGVLIGVEVALDALGLSSFARPWGVSLSLVAAMIGGARIVYIAFEALLAGRIGADFVLAQACIAAILLGRPFVAAEVVFIAIVGEWLESIAFDRAQAAIRGLLARAPSSARIRRDGVESVVPIREIAIGDMLIVAPGESIAADGIITRGATEVDQSALSGESQPVERGVGDNVFAGTLNRFGAIEVGVEKVGSATTLGQVERLVREFRRKKAPLERLADRLARYFLPVVEGAALATLLVGWLLHWPDVWSRAVAVLVTACPCALVLATPAAVLAASARLARRGIIAKGGAAIERLAGCDTFVFDKTGTLTTGAPRLASIVAFAGAAEDSVLSLAASAETAIDHPLAHCLAAAARERGIALSTVREAHLEPGMGVTAQVERASGEAAQAVLIGNAKLLALHQVAIDPDAAAALQALDARGETPLWAASDGVVIGLFGAADAVRPEAHDVIHDLKHLGIKHFAILTGDREAPAKAAAKRVHIATVVSGLLPAEKASWIEERQAGGAHVAMVGDGINDAPALARADAGIAVAKFGANLAAEAGDFVALCAPLEPLPEAYSVARAMTSIICQNILIFAFGLNAVAIAAASLGVLDPVGAAILHQAGSLLTLLNAMRLLVHGRLGETAPVRGLKTILAAVRRFDDRIDPGKFALAAFSRRRWIVAAAATAALAAWLSTAVRTIEVDQAGVLKRWGRYAGILEPGLHVGLPWPIDEVIRLKPDRLESARVGFPGESRRTAITASVRWEADHSRGTGDRPDANALVMTGDERFVEATLSAHYRIAGGSRPLRAQAFRFVDSDRAIALLAEASARAEIARRPLSDLLSEKRASVETEILGALQRRVDRLGLGITVVAVALEDIHPPLAVVDSYREVTRAENISAGLAIAGASYAETSRREAAATANATRNRARAECDARKVRSRASADAFRAVSDARSGASAVTDIRLFWESLAKALAGRRKVIIDEPVAGAKSPRRLFWPDPPRLQPPTPGVAVPSQAKPSSSNRAEP